MRWGSGAQGGEYPEAGRSGDSDVTRIVDRDSDMRLGYATRTGDSDI